MYTTRSRQNQTKLHVRNDEISFDHKPLFNFTIDKNATSNIDMNIEFPQDYFFFFV